jgi:hypothetical protein
VHFGERGNHVVLREMGPQLSFLRPYGRLAHRCYSLPIGSGPTALRRRSNHCTALRTVFQLVAQKIFWYSGAEVVWQCYSSGLRTFERRTLADQTRVHGVATLLLVGNTRGRRAEPVASLRAGRGNLSHIYLPCGRTLRAGEEPGCSKTQNRTERRIARAEVGSLETSSGKVWRSNG